LKRTSGLSGVAASADATAVLRVRRPGLREVLICYSDHRLNHVLDLDQGTTSAGTPPTLCASAVTPRCNTPMIVGHRIWQLSSCIAFPFFEMALLRQPRSILAEKARSPLRPAMHLQCTTPLQSWSVRFRLAMQAIDAASNPNETIRIAKSNFNLIRAEMIRLQKISFNSHPRHSRKSCATFNKTPRIACAQLDVGETFQLNGRQNIIINPLISKQIYRSPPIFRDAHLARLNC
jgi:hypothetical protein